MDKTIDMAREAGWPIEAGRQLPDTGSMSLKHFEALVRADEAAKYTWNVHSCGPTCTKAACVAMRKAVEAEREACAKVCGKLADEALAFGDENAVLCFEEAESAIRARGNT
jgi:hypothetical protein